LELAKDLVFWTFFLFFLRLRWLLSLWRRRLSASFGRFLLEQSFQTALNGSLSHGAGNVADVGLRFRARKFSGQIEWDLKPALIIGEILALLCAADDVLGKLLGQQEQGAKINGVVECEPALSLRFRIPPRKSIVSLLFA
jgi:hypothetical protein